jgi:general secretion pathway protein B
MSYILDALRRAQADRERGQVPGLMAQPTPTIAPRQRAMGSSWLLWVLCAAALVLAVAAVFSFTVLHRAVPSVQSKSLATHAERVAPVATGAPAPASAAARPAVPAPVAATTQTPPAATEFSLPSAPPAAGGNSPWPTVVSAPPPPPSVVGPGSIPAAATIAASGPMPSVAARAAAAPDVPSTVAATPLAALSPELRREWPPLNIGGSVWSDQPASRFVLVNGQVVREGETMAPGLVLERIAPKAGLVRWRGMVVEVPL